MSFLPGSQYTKDDILKVSTPGIYFIACQLILSTKSINVFTLAVNVNKENISRSSLQVTSSQLEEKFKLQVSGIVRIEHSGIIQIFIISQTPAVDLKLETSDISLFLISQKLFIQAISVQLTNGDKHHTIRYIDKISSIPWESGYSSGSIISTNLFMTSSGYLIIEEDGSYIITVNGIILSREHGGCKHSVEVYGNNNILLLYTTKLTQSYRHNVTVTTAGLLYFKRNDKIWMKFQSSCKSSIVSKYSTWTLSKLAALPGICLKCVEHDSYRQIGWIQLDLSNFKFSHKGGFKSKQFKKDKNSLKLEKKGVVLLTITLKIKTQHNTSGLRLAISKNVLVNKDTATTSPSDIVFVDTLGEMLDQTTLQIQTLLKVERNDVFRFYLFLPRQFGWLVLKSSMISMLYIQQIENPLTEAIVIDTVQENWISLPHCFDTRNSLFSSKDGAVRIFENGFYYVIINVGFYHSEVKNTKELIDVELKFQRTSSEKVLLYSSESSVRLQRSLKLSGMLILSYEDEYQVLIRKPISIPINVSCTAHLQFLGHQSVITGFQAILSKDVKTQNTGFINMIDEILFIDDSDSDSFKDGTFTASTEGIYLVSVNIIAKDIRMMTSEDKVALLLIRNSIQKTLYYTQRQKKLNYINSDRDAIITLTLAGTIKLNKNDKLHLQVYITDKNVVFDKQSTFSIVFVGPEDEVNGLIYVRNIRSTSSSAELWRTIDGWDLPVTKEFSLGTFQGKSPFNILLTNDSNFIFKKDGLYLITFHVLLKQKQNEKEFQVRFVKHSDLSYKQCDDFFNQFEVSATSCQFIHYFNQGDVYSFQIYNADGVVDEDFFPITHGINRAYISVLHLKAPRSYQFLATILKVKCFFLLLN